MRRRWIAAPVATALLLAAVGPGCIQGVGGPYPCDPGYASCHGGGYGADPACETDIATDPQNCGACGTTCPVGAVCVDSACGAPPTVLTTDASPAELGIDTADLFYWSNQHGAVNGLPKAGGSPYDVALPGAWGNVGSAGVTPFAVDDSGVYYVAQNDSGTGPPTLAVSSVRPDGTSQVSSSVGALPSSSGGAGSVGILYGLWLSGSTVFVVGDVASSSGQGDVGIWSVATTGGALTHVSTFSNNGVQSTSSTIAIDASGVYFVRDGGQGNSPNACEIDRVPNGGGSPSPLVTFPNGGACPTAVASDGTNLYWSIPPTTYTDENGDQQCSGGTVYDIPVHGGSTSTLTQFPGTESALAIAADSGTLYVATDESVWRVPGSGGAARRIAGNLQVVGQSTCCGCSSGGGGGASPVSMAIDGTNVYVATPSGLLRLPK